MFLYFNHDELLLGRNISVKATNENGTFSTLLIFLVFFPQNLNVTMVPTGYGDRILSPWGQNQIKCRTRNLSLEIVKQHCTDCLDAYLVF